VPGANRTLRTGGGDGRTARVLRRLATTPPVRRVRTLATAPRSADGVMLALGAAVGLGTGLLAVLLIEVIRGIGALALGTAPTMATVVISTTMGGLVVGILVTYWMPEARGGGVTHVMESIALHGGRMRPGLALGKLLTTGVSLGSGAAGGREGPIVQIGGSVGSTLGRAFALSEEQKRALIAAGAAAGIAASFNAPIGGMLFAVEVIIGGFRLRYLQVIVVSSVVASVTARQIIGDDLIYNPPPYSLGGPVELGFYVLVGLIAVAAGLALAHGEQRTAQLFARLRVWPPLRTALAGLLLGLLALGLPEILGTGESLPRIPGASTTQPIGEMLAGSLGGVGFGAAGFLLLLAVAKLVAALLTLGGGYAVGSLGPSIFIGAALGGAVGHTAQALLPDATIQPGALAVAGMAAVMASANRAPLTAILIAFELTGDYDMVVPLMLSVGIATLVSDRLSDESVYTLPLVRRGIVYGEPEDIDIMQTVRVGEIMTRSPSVVPADLPVEDLHREFRRTRHHGFPVVDGDRLVGVVTLTDLARAAGDATADIAGAAPDVQRLTAADICTRRVLTVTPDDPVFRALRRMASIDVGRLPVVAEDDHGRLVGLVRRADIVKAYQRAVSRSVGVQQRSASSQLRDLTGTQLIEVVIDADAEVAGAHVREVAWPPRTILTSIRRRGDIVLPNGETRLEPGDEVVVLTAADRVEEVRTLLAGDPGPAAPSG
jgi:chloride channel protein, CIC family